MDNSLNIVNHVTLECMMNPLQYNKYIKLDNQNEKKAVDVKERKFYRKRILSLTRDLFKNNIEDTTMASSFNSYIKSCIAYIQFIDRSDTIQEDYKDISSNIEVNKSVDYEDINNLMFSDTEAKICTLDTFVNVKNKRTQRKILPKQKNINLSDSKFKNKGIKKKKNIHNNYEDEKK